MDLRDVEYFAVVAEHCHLGRAAEALGLSQPALSMALRRLERSAQTKLVRRTPKGVELTAVGLALLRHVARLRLARDELSREVADLAQGKAGHLRIGTSPSNAEVGLPEACSKLLMEAPKVTLSIVVMDNDLLLPALQKGEIDLALTHTRQAHHPEIGLEPIRADEFVPFCASGHRLARKRVVTLEDLAPERWAVARSAAGSLGPLNLLRQALGERGLPAPRIVLTSDLISFRLRAIAESDLLGVAVTDAIRAAPARLRLQTLSVQGLEWGRPAVAAYRKEAYLPPAGRRFIEILKAGARASMRASA
jgi:DNA-binding transcriptional LysR family regulator